MARGAEGGRGGGGKLALLIVAFVVVVAAIAWLVMASNRGDGPELDVKVPAPDVLPERTPETPPVPLPTPSG